MVTETTQQTSQKEELATRTGELTPFREFPSALGWMRDEFDRLLQQFSRNWPHPWRGNGWRWRVEVEDGDDALFVRAEAPGFEPGDFEIRVADSRLIMQAVRKEETRGKVGNGREYRVQECYESVTLPPGIDKNKVEAQYRNGILTVTLPRTTDGKARRITVKS